VCEPRVMGINRSGPADGIEMLGCHREQGSVLSVARERRGLAIGGVEGGQECQEQDGSLWSRKGHGLQEFGQLVETSRIPPGSLLIVDNNTNGLRLKKQEEHRLDSSWLLY